MLAACEGHLGSKCTMYMYVAVDLRLSAPLSHFISTTTCIFLRMCRFACTNVSSQTVNSAKKPPLQPQLTSIKKTEQCRKTLLEMLQIWPQLTSVKTAPAL